MQQPDGQLNSDGSGYLSTGTICALASGVGGALCVVRVSGPSVGRVLARMTKKSVDFFEARARQAIVTALFGRDGRKFDEAMVLFFKGPKSFTGEDVAEFHLHGSPFILSALISELGNLGVRQALPGEFSFRAVRNGKMTLPQAQAVADLISASNRSAAELALEKLSGAQSAVLQGIADELRRIAVLSEVGIDFSDQDVDEVSLPTLKSHLGILEGRIEVLLKSFERGEKIQDGVSVSLIGLPNAGKSSFFNALLGEDRSIVSPSAGTTRDIVRERLVLEDRGSTVTLRLADTAGVRDTSDEVERAGVERSLAAARKADLILWVVDGSDANPDARAELERYWAALGGPKAQSFGIMTKSDLWTGASPGFFEDKMSVAHCSALTGQGVHEAAVAVVHRCQQWVGRAQGEVILTREEDRRAVEECLSHLNRAMGASEEDLFASDLKQALRALSRLIGDTVPDDILGTIFSGFCIGK